MKLKLLLFFASILLLTHQFSQAQTYVSGNISSNATWTISGNPYIVTDDLIIDTGITLTISPGITVKFDKNKSLVVDGTIVGSGKSDSVILFTADTTNASGPFWSGVFISNAAEPFNANTLAGCQFKYCTFEFTGTENFFADTAGIILTVDSKVSVGMSHCLVQWSYGRVETAGTSAVSNSIFKYNKSDSTSGPLVKLGSNSVINQDIFYNNQISGPDGIVSATKNVKVYENVFVKNQIGTYPALTVTDSSLVYKNIFVDNNNFDLSVDVGTCYNNTIVRNQENVGAVSITNPSPKFYNNNILSNYLDAPGGNDLEFIGTTQGASQTAVVENNWWGTTDASAIASLILDHTDNSNLCTVDFTPFLSSPDIDAPPVTPTQVFKTLLPSGDVIVRWNKNKETDLAGYRVYYGGFNGYSFSSLVDVDLDTSHVLSNVTIDDTIGVTAYDVDANGNSDQLKSRESWFTYAVTDTTFTAINEPGNNHDQYFQIYPNPCSASFLIQSSELSSPNSEIVIQDILGREVERIIPMHSDQLTVSSDGLSSGMYEVQLIVNGNVVDRGKLLVQKNF